MDAATLASAMGCSMSTARKYVHDFNVALRQANCTTVNRVAMFCAQVGHESAGLYYMEEIASGAAYEGRRDLGNIYPGDGRRFKGRGPIQLTGRHNYGKFGQWAKSRGLVSNANYFVNNPHVVATSRWGFLAASWYWTVARPMNTYADRGDIYGASRAVNGGLNGITDRINRWNRCRRLGNRLLPSGGAAPKKPQPKLHLIGEPMEIPFNGKDAWTTVLIAVPQNGLNLVYGAAYDTLWVNHIKCIDGNGKVLKMWGKHRVPAGNPNWNMPIPNGTVAVEINANRKSATHAPTVGFRVKY